MITVVRPGYPSRLVLFVALLGFGIGLTVARTSTWPATAGGSCSQAADAIGSDAPDNFLDTPGTARTFTMKGGGDKVEARDCRDDVFGQAAADQLHGAGHSDLIVGGDAADGHKSNNPFGVPFVVGGDGDDRVEGNNGDDDVLDQNDSGGDQDTLFGGQDDDDLNAQDGDGQDTLNGDAGNDHCVDLDPGDNPNSCIVDV